MLKRRFEGKKPSDFVFTKKGGKEYPVIMATTPKLKIEYHRIIDKDNFTNNHMKPLQQSCFGITKIKHENPHIQKQLRKEAEAKYVISVHGLRHTYGFLFALNGGKPEVLQEHFGHADINTTMIYFHLAKEYLKKEANRVSYKKSVSTDGLKSTRKIKSSSKAVLRVVDDES